MEIFCIFLAKSILICYNTTQRGLVIWKTLVTNATIWCMTKNLTIIFAKLIWIWTIWNGCIVFPNGNALTSNLKMNIELSENKINQTFDNGTGRRLPPLPVADAGGNLSWQIKEQCEGTLSEQGDYDLEGYHVRRTDLLGVFQNPFG